MRKLLVGLALLSTLASASCARSGELVPGIPEPHGGPASPVPVRSGSADQPTPSALYRDPDFPKPHRSFAAHFVDPLYFDEGAEFSPFGSDEGSDTLAVWRERRSELTKCTTLRWMIAEDDQAGALDEPDQNGPVVDGFIISAGFALILFTGHIDTEGKLLVLEALHRTYSYYAKFDPREPAVMIRDLEKFPATDCVKP